MRFLRRGRYLSQHIQPQHPNTHVLYWNFWFAMLFLRQGRGQSVSAARQPCPMSRVRRASRPGRWSCQQQTPIQSCFQATLGAGADTETPELMDGPAAASWAPGKITHKWCTGRFRALNLPQVPNEPFLLSCFKSPNLCWSWLKENEISFPGSCIYSYWGNVFTAKLMLASSKHAVIISGTAVSPGLGTPTSSVQFFFSKNFSNKSCQLHQILLRAVRLFCARKYWWWQRKS